MAVDILCAVILSIRIIKIS